MNENYTLENVYEINLYAFVFASCSLSNPGITKVEVTIPIFFFL